MSNDDENIHAERLADGVVVTIVVTAVVGVATMVGYLLWVVGRAALAFGGYLPHVALVVAAIVVVLYAIGLVAEVLGG